MKKGLTEKERLFCFYFAEDGDARGCAARAGFSVAPKRSAARLLGREEIRAEIAKLEKGDILVVGCSSSEVSGGIIGKKCVRLF